MLKVKRTNCWWCHFSICKV